MKLAVLLIAGLPLIAQTSTIEHCAELRHHGDPSTKSCYEALAQSRNPAIQAEGYSKLGDFQAAYDAFTAAVKLNPNDPDLHVRFGRMWLDHWLPGDAGDEFAKALKIKKDYAPALLGEALVAAQNYEGNAEALARKALESDPKLVEAQELLASIALEDSDEQKASVEAKKAIDMSKESLDAMSILGTIDLLDDKKDSPWFGQILKINPRYGEAYETAGHFFFINRRYDEEMQVYRKALEIEPDLWSAHSALGVALMRQGQNEEAFKELQTAYGNGFKNPQTVNTLRLMDSYKNYDTFRTPTTALFLNKKEAALLRPYFQTELNGALATYEKKYHYRLTQPVEIEVYPNHDDFAVRTMGMPGLGALGVTFGYHVAMDSPSGRTPGEFHWDSTMWHELSHVYVLAMTNNRVPRWFTEGLAVYEETANGHPDWGDRLGPEDIDAIKTKKLLPVEDLDRGFIHPTYPAQVNVSYFEGGKICSFIAEKWGYDKILAMIHDFAALTPTPQVIEKEFQMKPEEFDRQFFAWLDDETKTTVDGFDQWKKQIRDVSEKAKAKNWDAVIQEGTAIQGLYTDYVEAGSVYEFLAQAWIAKGDKAKATAELEEYAKVGGRNPGTLKQLAGLQVEAGRKQDAAATLQRLNLIYLEDIDAHKQLGDLYMDLGNTEGASREFGAVIACDPVDKAGAHYDLARALNAGHHSKEARDEVLTSLETAPGFRPAQKLLLELSK